MLNELIYILVMLVRLVASTVLALNILPRQWQELRTEKNGLKKIKLYLFMLGNFFFILNFLSLLYNGCKLYVGCPLDMFSNAFILANAASTLFGTYMLYLIYNRKY